MDLDLQRIRFEGGELRLNAREVFLLDHLMRFSHRLKGKKAPAAKKKAARKTAKA